MQLFSEWGLKDTDDRFRKRAACIGEPAETFFPERGANTAIVRAKQICGVCEVRKDCLRYALNNKFEFGIWGGTSANQRIRKRAQLLKEVQ